MNIGIITFSSAHNYGAMLQTYALQTILEMMGFQVDIINFRPPVIDNIYNPFKKIRGRLFDFKFYKQRAGLHIKHRYKIKKFKNFEMFMENNLNITRPYKTFNELRLANLNYDFFIAGSDQIWNSDLTKILNPSYFLKFAPKKSKKITYGASMGKKTVNEFEIPLFKHYLKNIDSISVREKVSIDSLSKCTSKQIETVIDPTLLLKKEDYNLLKNDMDLNNKKYIFVYALEYNEDLIKIAEKVSKDENLPVIFNRPYKKFSKQIRSVPYIGPSEFLGLVNNARYIITNSYHGLIFSIIYNKKFVAIPNTKTPARMEELATNLNVLDALFYSSNNFNNIQDIKIDYEKVEKNLENLKNESLLFLEKSLKKNEFDISEKSYLDDGDKFKCYGCCSCKEMCPNSSIIMKTDFEGFIYPKIDQKTCNQCDICKKVCIYSNDEILEKNENYPKVFASYNENHRERICSSSGGIFLPLARRIIKEGGYVIGARYTEDMGVKHTIGINMKECEKFSGSKYVKSDIDGLFQKIKKLISKNKPILFVGVPCQVAGLKSYLKSENTDKIYLVEILCHSNPSPKVFKKYVSYLKEKHNSPVLDFEFKDKKNGWNKPSLHIKFENGKEIHEDSRFNNYNRGFQTSLFARPCCYECEFVASNRVGDMTIGDFWGIENIEKTEKKLKDDKGVSLVILNNKKGESLFNSIKDKVNYFEEDMEKAFIKNHKFPIVLNKKRYKFFSKIEKEPINDILLSFNDVKTRYSKENKTKKAFKTQLKRVLNSFNNK